MFRLVEGRREIANCQRRLEQVVKSEFQIKARRDIGFPSSTVRNLQISTDGELWFHTRDHDEGTPRRLNWFGALKQAGSLSITIEVNTPYIGRVDRTSGYFIRDSETDRVFLAHSGRVGGGTAGVGKDEFLAWSELPLNRAMDSAGEIKSGILVASLDGPIDGVAGLRRYIDLVRNFKIAVRAGETKTTKFRRKVRAYKEFYSEARGRRRGTRSSEIDYVTHHGKIVDAINVWRISRPMPHGGRIVKDVAIDLGVCVGSKLVEIYEAKPSADRSSVYTAIGQVLVHGADRTCQRILVLPDGEVLKADLSDALARLDIKILRFRLSRSGAAILN